MHRFWLVTHRWIGIITMPVMIIVGLTGAVLVWYSSKGMAGLHVNLGLGRAGHWIVNVVTVAGSFLVIGGFILWWRRKIYAFKRFKGWWRFLFDLHHVVGVFGAALMLVIALSGTGLMLTADIGNRLGLDRTDPNYPTRNERLLRTVAHWSHTARPVKGTLGIFWAICSVAFAVQALTGIVMWWKPPKNGD